MIMKISVIIPTYKPKEYLWECLQSLVKQTLAKEEFEVILVLNGCTQPWKEEIENYIASKMKGVDINFIHTVQGGVSNARNIALENAKGEYITFIDDDDYVSPSYLQELLQKSSEHVVCLSNVVSFIDGNKTGILDSVYNRIFRKNCSNLNVKLHDVRQYLSCPVMKLIHRDMIGSIRFDVRFKNGEDTLFIFSISDKINKIDFTSENAIYYRRIRKDSATTSKRSSFSRLLNAIHLVNACTHVYLKGIFRYNFTFYLSRVLGILKPRFNNL